VKLREDILDIARSKGMIDAGQVAMLLNLYAELDNSLKKKDESSGPFASPSDLLKFSAGTPPVRKPYFNIIDSSVFWLNALKYDQIPRSPYLYKVLLNCFQKYPLALKDVFMESRTIGENYKPSRRSYNTILQALSPNYPKATDEIFSLMLKDGARPDFYTYLLMINAQVHDEKRFGALFDELEANGMSIRADAMTKLMLSHENDAKVVDMIFSRIKYPDTWAFNIRMKAHSSDPEEVDWIFAQIPSPDDKSYMIRLSSHASVRGPTTALDLLKSWRKSGLPVGSSTGAYNILLSAPGFDSNAAERLFSEIREIGIVLNISSYTPIIRALVGNLSMQKELFDKLKNAGELGRVNYLAKEIYEQVKQSGELDRLKNYDIKSCTLFFNALLKALMGDIVGTNDVLMHMEKLGVPADAETYIAWMRTLVTGGNSNVHQVMDVYEKLTKFQAKPPVIACNLLLGALLRSGENVWPMLEKMRKMGVEFTSHTYLPLLISCRGDMNKINEILHIMEMAGIVPNQRIVSVVMSACAKSGEVRMAEKYFSEMHKLGIVKGEIVIYGALMECYARAGRHFGLIRTLHRMKTDGVKPRSHIWSIFVQGLSTCRRHKDVLTVWKYVSGQSDSLGLPDVPLLGESPLPSLAELGSVFISIMLDSCKFGRFKKEAKEVWNCFQRNVEIPAHPNVLTSYIEALIFFGESESREAEMLIDQAERGEGLPLRNVKPDAKTLLHFRSGLRTHRRRSAQTKKL
ncbi:MAG: hypothetical protein SGCHY_005649, partial [Lobulomycetales sp.]